VHVRSRRISTTEENRLQQAPQIIPQSKLSKEQQEKHKELAARKLQGVVSIVINENGDVVAAKAAQSSQSPPDQLEALAMSMKFTPRPGCGFFKISVVYSIGR
jgi:hypothetical protein